MIFSIQNIAVTDPEDKKVTVELADLMLGTCLGCGQKLLMGRGQYRFMPISPTMSGAREILRDSVDRALHEPVDAPTPTVTE